MRSSIEKPQEQKRIVKVATFADLVRHIKEAQPGARFRIKSSGNQEYVKENLETSTGKKVRVQWVPNLELTDERPFDIEVLR